MQILVKTYVLYFVVVGVYVIMAAYIGITFWTWTGERQVRRIRTAYFEAVMRQSVGWFDEHKSGELNSHMVEDMEMLSDGFGDKMAAFIQWSSTSLGGFVMGFFAGWKLSLVAISTCPVFILILALVGKFIREYVKKELRAYAKAGAIADETFSSIRTVVAFGGEKKAADKFSGVLQFAMKDSIGKIAAACTIAGSAYVVAFGLTSLTLWYGAKLTREECMQPGTIIQVFFGVLTGAMYMGNAAPLLQNFASARAAATALFETIDAHVEIDSLSEKGLKPKSIGGEIQFQDVNFSYPSRKGKTVLNGLNISVKKGEKVALVGESGCGKSTVVQLVQRFYECDKGKILIDGKDLKSYNLNCLRNYMGIVSQEPVLFATTIGENIRLGAKCGDEVTQERIEQAAKLSNCYDFICQLPQGFDTPVGDRGVQLSGGQKQRIAIARALVRDPAILLLDEATSALDAQSEALVQEALDHAGEGRTILVIAHRLSTVKSANKIYVFQNGKVHEEGTHDYLMSIKGVYYSLVMRQLQQEKEEQQDSSHLTVKNNKHSAETEDYSNFMPASPTLTTSSTLVTNDNRDISTNLTSDGKTFRQKLNAMNSGVVIDEDAMKAKVLTPKHELGMAEIMKMNRPEWYLIAIGTFSAIINGTTHLVFALLLSEILGALSQPNLEEQRERVNTLALYTIIAGLITGIAMGVQHFTLALSGERLTARLRTLSFSALVRQEIAFFDKEENGVGFITSRLSSDAPLVKGATGARIGVLTQASSTIVGALLIAFVYIWELGLAAMLFIPVMIAAGKVQERMVRGHSLQDKLGIEEGGKMAQEAISNMRTVTSLNRQRYFTDKFRQHFKHLYQADKRKSWFFGIAYSISQSPQFFMSALCFGLGGYLVVSDNLLWRAEKIPFYYVIRIYATVTFGSIAAGKCSSQLPDFSKAKSAAFSIQKLLMRKSSIDSSSSAGKQPNKVKGHVEFNRVEFSYPTREGVKVLQKTTFNVESGETLALVGASGCGKSTSISLLERFYDSVSGQVAIDGDDVKGLNIQWLRHQLGMVSQEPTLFDMTIRENIAYGDNRREVAIDEIIEAARKANAHGFITSLPQGYETNVGAKGTQLSGGQKQRIAIARALVRNPAILLLDEATSALDAESEKIVQEALERAMAGRTAIIIAHRLSTIKNANKIGVIEDGRIVEMGSHEELIEKKGCYYNLIQAQL
ncbi:ATP-dependent translocase ABCB1-like [Watersipora subatra]|uniref:ATP-dependent translocase ABCB1-like n=1 Tax=Watersipora subatra TaxID=2589382 RepID=UPI00355BF5A4